MKGARARTNARIHIGLSGDCLLGSRSTVGSQINTCMHPVYQRLSAGGHNTECTFNDFSKGDTVLNYMYVLYAGHSMLMSLVNKDLDGGAGVESASFLTPVSNSSLGGSLESQPSDSRRVRSVRAAEAERQHQERTSGLSAMAASIASMAESSRRRLAVEMVRHLSAALSAAKAANRSELVVKALEKRVLEATHDCGCGTPVVGAIARKRARAANASGDETDASSDCDEQ